MSGPTFVEEEDRDVGRVSFPSKTACSSVSAKTCPAASKSIVVFSSRSRVSMMPLSQNSM
jgi:hypothetical protein